MSIRPIDIITIAPKSQEVSQVHYNEMRGREHAENTVSQNFQRTEEHNSQRTIESAKSETNNYNFDAKDGSGNSYKGHNSKKKNKKSKDDDNSLKSPFSNGFDITI